ncbi:endonuclease/exonuclease/phosphatase family protein [Pacificibacter marinus]|uniref:Endonuclease/Exonuclease/phosphatase family protein n=1 Tax=Pacificibacter marinus TaxID=658057 RepID=A0A1Y5SJI8_9RHOB|nr:endonuclease/exonuclease/phosphatase family protein [Pacificibacter marinus]SEK59667.1 Endonuclease/Exonuclease/phosphatase family protein [Pacificibacter marinus]SLN42295.1 Endonuclease/Exonuclease/phosphatase family protein [Pacificibacter marinus]
MRIATYNVEWFDALFDEKGRLQLDDDWSARRDVTRRAQIEALSFVFNALEADAVMVIEAPDTSRRRDTVTALEQFADFAGIRARAVETGFINDTQQEIALLYDPLVLRAKHDPKGSVTVALGGAPPAFDSVYHLDLDTDMSGDPVRFSKPPLELHMELRETGFSFRMIGVHIKSKAPYGARNRDHEIRIAIENRRKQVAQCIWLRQRIEQHLIAGEPVIVLGDFNDGPGLDEYERLFGRSGIEIVIGEGTGGTSADQRLFDPHARMAIAPRASATPTSSRFYVRHEKRYLSALLDYVMVSQDLAPKGKWRIWHPFEDAECYDTVPLREALLRASDHFPVTVDLDL